MTRNVYGWDAQGLPTFEQMMTDAEIEAAIDAAIAAIPPSGASVEPWEGAIAGAWGNGNPTTMLSLMQAAGVVSPTPTNIGITVARCSFFRLKTALTVANLRWYGIGATTGIYHMGIYRASDRVRLTADLSPNTTANAWNSVAAGGVQLAAGTLYYLAVSVDTVGTTSGILAMGPTLAATAGQIAVLPTAWPGNLDIDAATPRVEPAALAQFTVTAGVLPTPGPVLVAPAAWTGGMPAVFLDAA